jgi:hypothetical protein
MFVLSAQYLIYKYKLNINWHTAVILGTSNWKLEKYWFPVMISHLHYCIHVLHIMCHVPQSSTVELPTLGHYYNMVAKARFCSSDELLHCIQSVTQNTSTTCREWIHDGCHQQYLEWGVQCSAESEAATYCNGHVEEENQIKFQRNTLSQIIFLMLYSTNFMCFIPKAA